ncbi:MAG: hypothetical protein E7620_05380 [Ruminococcaceae bacterium]|nr:hypothetical protein [Oscillospiraceae bacterium]
MKSKELREIEKRFKERQQEEESRQKVAQAIDNLKSQSAGLNELIKVYDDMAFEAAKEGKQDIADDIIETITEIEDFRDQLSVIETRIVMETKAAQALKAISALSETLNDCKTIFAKTTDITRIAQNLAGVTKSIASGREQFRELRQLWKGDATSQQYRRLFGEPLKKDDPRFAQRVLDRKKALEARLVRDMADQAAMPASPTVTVGKDDVAGVADIASMLDDERNK